MQVSTLLKEVVSSLDLQLNVYAVEDLGSNNYKAYVDSTQYIKAEMKIVLDGVTYKVIDFVLNKTVTLNGTTPITVQSYTLANPFFIHGKLKPTNSEVVRAGKTLKISPMIWNFELQPRNKPTEVDTVLESTGTVKVFFMADARFQDYSSEQHLIQVIEPMNNLVNSFIQGVKDHKRSGLVFETLRLNHAKFTTGGGATASDENIVLGREQSGIELELTLPIMMDFRCPVREYPE